MDRMRFLTIVLTLLLVITAVAQETASDTTEFASKRPLTPSIVIDYGKLLAIPLGNETKYEVGIELLIKEKIPLIVEGGYASLTPSRVYSNGSYESEGLYARIGAGIYSQFQPKNKLGLVLMFGAASFEERATVDNDNTINIPRTLVASFDRKDISASWLELVLYSDRKINDLLSLGMKLRLRYLLLHDRFVPNELYAIPGYGRSFDTTIPAVNLFVKFSL